MYVKRQDEYETGREPRPGPPVSAMIIPHYHVTYVTRTKLDANPNRVLSQWGEALRFPRAPADERQLWSNSAVSSDQKLITQELCLTCETPPFLLLPRTTVQVLLSK